MRAHLRARARTCALTCAQPKRARSSMADAGEVKTREPEAQLVEGGWGPDIKMFEAAQVAKGKRTNAAARRAAAGNRTDAAAQQEGSTASRKRSGLLKELDSTLLL